MSSSTQQEELGNATGGTLILTQKKIDNLNEKSL